MKHQIGCFLFRSEIASYAGAGCIGDIAKMSRRFNEDNEITGILIFDGQRFVQYMEGPQLQVTALSKKISEDIRHINFTPLHQAMGITHRIFSDWTMAYFSVEDTEPLAQMWIVDGEAAMSCLQQLLPHLDAE